MGTKDNLMKEKGNKEPPTRPSIFRRGDESFEHQEGAEQREVRNDSEWHLTTTST